MSNDGQIFSLCSFRLYPLYYAVPDDSDTIALRDWFWDMFISMEYFSLGIFSIVDTFLLYHAFTCAPLLQELDTLPHVARLSHFILS